MPIVTKKPLTKPNPLPNPAQIVSAEVKNNLIDTKRIPVSSLLTNVEGSKWVVDLYTQVLNRDDALAGHDVGQAPIYQQYKLIKNFELKVTTGLTTSQDSETKTMSVTGAAYVHSSVIVNHGDAFIADVGDGKLAIFQVTLSEQKSIFTSTVYFIEYVLISYVTENNRYREDLDSKVVATYYYVKDFTNYGNNPLITDKEFNSLVSLEELQNNLIEYYFRWFYNVDRKTVLVPGQDLAVYDHFMVNFLLSIVENKDHLNVRNTKVFNVQDDLYLEEPTVLTAILQKDKDLLNSCIKKTKLVSTRLFTIDPMMDGIRYSQVPLIVYPNENEKLFSASVVRILPKASSNIGLANVSSSIDSLSNLITDNTLNEDLQATIYPVLKDDYYIFSKAFYDNSPGQSLLENTVNSFIRRNEINPSTIIEISKDYYKWGGLERFYYIPVIIAMIKYLLFRSN